MHTRINKITETLGISKTDFAKGLNLSQGMISRLCSGSAKPSDRTIADICRVYNVNRKYLEHGEEPMFLPEIAQDVDFVNVLLENSESPFVGFLRAAMLSYVELSPADRKIADAFVKKLKENLPDDTFAAE